SRTLAACAPARSKRAAGPADDQQARLVEADPEGLPDPRERKASEQLSMPVPDAKEPEPRGSRPADGRDRWYAVWPRSRHEQAVRTQLDERAIPAFLPTVSRWSRWKDRKKRIEVPLFPGYVFARFDPATRLAVLTRSGEVARRAFTR